MNAPVIYIPSTQPPPLPLLRQLAYQREETLPGPHDDPKGWTTLEPVTISGILLDDVEVDAEYTLSLAKPVS